MKLVLLDTGTLGDDISTELFSEFGEVTAYRSTAADEVEAYRFYRKSMKLGYRKAEIKVKAMEKLLRERVEE